MGWLGGSRCGLGWRKWEAWEDLERTCCSRQTDYPVLSTCEADSETMVYNSEESASQKKGQGAMAACKSASHGVD